MHYAVMLLPSTMEDAGRTQLLCVKKTRNEAEAFIAQEVDDSNGYYGRGSYAIYKEERT